MGTLLVLLAPPVVLPMGTQKPHLASTPPPAESPSSLASLVGATPWSTWAVEYSTWAPLAAMRVGSSLRWCNKNKRLESKSAGNGPSDLISVMKTLKLTILGAKKPKVAILGSEKAPAGAHTHTPLIFDA